jgi:hypothetical protein
MTKLPPVAKKLLDAHVDWWEDTLSDTGVLEARIRSLLAVVLADFERLKLKDVVTVAQVQKTARTYAIELDLKGGLPELVRGVANDLYAAPVIDETRIQDVLPEAHFIDMLDKALEFESLRSKLVHAVLASPFYKTFASDLLYRGIRDYVTTQGEVANKIPGAGSMMKLGKSVLARAKPDLENSMEQGLRKYIARTIEGTSERSADLFLAKLDSETLRGMGMEIWQDIKRLPLRALRDDITQTDIEDLFVLGYAYWGDLRNTKVFGGLLDAGIESFFSQYNDQTLATLLDDLGVTEEMMVTEAMRYAPPVIKTLKKKKMLRPLIEHELADFYASPAVAKILG